MSSPKIFISHSHKDDAFTARLVADLRAAGADVWVDTTEIAYDDFIKRINNGLANRDWLILVQTPESLRSQWVQMEVNAAINLMMQGEMRGVIPLLAQPCERKDIPVMWRTLHFYDASSDYAGALSRLLHTIGLDAPPATLPEVASLSPEGASPPITSAESLGAADTATAEAGGSAPVLPSAHVPSEPPEEASRRPDERLLAVGKTKETAPVATDKLGAAETGEAARPATGASETPKPKRRRRTSTRHAAAAGAKHAPAGTEMPVAAAVGTAGVTEERSGLTCPHCGAPNAHDNHFCVRCGTSLATMPDQKDSAPPTATTTKSLGQEIAQSTPSAAMSKMAGSAHTQASAPPSPGVTSAAQAVESVIQEAPLTLQVAPTTPRRYLQRSRLVVSGIGILVLAVIAAVALPPLLGRGHGGGIWQYQSSGVSLWLDAVTCPSVSTCFAAGHTSAAVDPQSRSTIIATTDGGHSWQLQTSRINAALLDIACPSVTICYALGFNNTLWATTDAGNTWQGPSTIPGAAGIGSVRAMACPGTKTCHVVGDNGVVATTDGGHTWHNQDTNVAGLQDVSCPNTTTCYAVGDSIVATMDGHTWREQLSSAGDTVFAVSCPSTAVCYAVGWAGLLVTTTDGGYHWHKQTINVSAYLEGIDCPSTQICYAAGDNGQGDSGTIASTTDGGHSWHLQPGLIHSLSGIACPAAKTCYAVGDHGTILARS